VIELGLLRRVACLRGATVAFVVMGLVFVGMGLLMRNMGSEINKVSNPQPMVRFVS
jgi:hypothetical protein